MTSATGPRLNTHATVPNRRSGGRFYLSAVLLAAAMMMQGCPQEVIPPDGLILQVTSETPVGGGKIEALRIIVTDDSGNRLPVVVTDPSFNFALETTQDPTDGEGVYIGVDFVGTTFASAAATIQVTGRIGDRAVAVYEGQVKLDAKAVVAVPMKAVAEACDSDADGFLDCATPGCCPDGGLTVSDCEPASKESNPYGVENECEPCADEFDNDCSGGDVVCQDSDLDGVADCADCAPNNPDIYPGAVELCDDIDQNCDPTDDQSFTFDGQALGEACGVGICAGGVVQCDSNDLTKATCSSLLSALPQEQCNNGDDDNCNGVVDEGCGDIDGDGVPAFGPAGAVLDCNDLDAGIFPPHAGKDGAFEPCCVAGKAIAECDKNCDGTTMPCANDDLDGDGYVEPSDCAEGDPLVYPGAPERCGDGIDQDCFGGDLACDQVTDADGDGWPTMYNGVAVDCDDADGDVNPGTAEICNGKDDNCDGLVDEGNPNPAAPGDVTVPDTLTFTSTGDACGSEIGECQVGTWACTNNELFTGEVRCNGVILPAAEWCDAKDNDCDGDFDEDFRWTGNGEDAAIGEACTGLGFCGGGQVECACPTTEACGTGALIAVCSTQPSGSEPQSSPEVCDTVDNDCDGLINEAVTDYAAAASIGACSDEGVCAPTDGVYPGSAMCNEDDTNTWTCNYAAVPGYEAGACPPGADPTACAELCPNGNCEQSCDGLDNNCDGDIDENFLEGVGCDGPDADNCKNGVFVCNPAGDGFVCNEDPNGGVNQPEVCDGVDNDCDGEIDEGFPLLGQPCDSEDSDECENGTYSCNANNDGVTCLVSSESVVNIQDICDGQDNDCDGSVDEDYVNKGQACDSPDSDQCQNSFFTCTPDGATTECLEVNESTANIIDICNGLDDDCDGMVDEDFPTKGDACDSVDSDLCLNGTLSCNGAGNGVECLVSSESVTDIIDICNGADDDCDGTADEDYDVGDSCDSNDSDQCPNGVKQCNGAQNGTVCIETVNFLEVCDGGGADEDCDGQVDEDWGPGGSIKLTGQPYTLDNGRHLGQSCGTGACAGGVVSCVVTGPNAGDILECSTAEEISSETCNGIDDDCDGTTDEGFTLSGALFSGDNGAGVGDSCGTGLCAGGTVECTGLSSVQCSSDKEEESEICNGVDDDCDGQLDETIGNCNDGLSCTDDTCSGGGCVNTVVNGSCRINGVCYAHNDVNPANACQRCNANGNQNAWSNRANGLSCNADSNGCTQDDACQAGTCVAGSAPSCSDSLSCTDDVCNSTGNNSFTCTNPIKSNNCLIGGVCRSAGEDNPTNDCQECVTSNNTSWSNKNSGQSCGDSTNSTCTNPDTCNGSGVCQNNHASNGTSCGGTPGTCEAQDVCQNGTCQDQGDSPAGTPCGNTANNACTDPDTCNGFGACLSNNEPNGTPCGTPGVCEAQDTCNNGSCMDQGFAALATPCGDPTNTDCDKPDSCDGAGTCEDNFVSAGTACGSTDNNACTNPDSCDGSGTCNANNEPNGTDCDSDGNVCTEDTCFGGTCSLGAVNSCDDSNECTIDVCTHPSGCSNTNVPNGTACSGGMCTDGACE